MSAFVYSTLRKGSHSLRLLFYSVAQDNYSRFLWVDWVLAGRSYFGVWAEEAVGAGLAAYYSECPVCLPQSLESNHVLV